MKDNGDFVSYSCLFQAIARRSSAATTQNPQKRSDFHIQNSIKGSLLLTV